MTTSILLPSDTDDGAGLADWLEATMLIENRAYLSRATIRKYMKSIFEDDEPDVPVDILMNEIGRRSRHCAAYPFGEDASGVTYTRGAGATAYIFMLCLSVSKPYRDEHRQND